MKSKVKCVLTFGLSGNDDLKEIKVLKGTLNWNFKVNGILIFHVFSFENDIIFFLESVVESYHLERQKEQELRLKTILRWARVGQFAADL